MKTAKMNKLRFKRICLLL